VWVHRLVTAARRITSAVADHHTVEQEIVRADLALLRLLSQRALNSRKMDLVAPSTTTGFAVIVNGALVAPTTASVEAMKPIVVLASAVSLQHLSCMKPRLIMRLESGACKGNSPASGGVSLDGHCGPKFPGNKTCAGTTFGACCSNFGFCGNGNSYCKEITCWRRKPLLTKWPGAKSNCFSGECLP
jgi:hypothetical protein